MTALATACSLVWRICAASLVAKPSTSRRISAARWRCGRTCSAATNASEIASRASYRACGLEAAQAAPGGQQRLLHRVLGVLRRYIAPFIIAGIGISMALPCVSAAGLNAVSPPSLGKAAGVMNTMQQFGAVSGIAVATTVFNAHGSLASAAAVTGGYRPALAVSAALSVLGATAALALRRTPHRARTPHRGGS